MLWYKARCKSDGKFLGSMSWGSPCTIVGKFYKSKKIAESAVRKAAPYYKHNPAYQQFVESFEIVEYEVVEKGVVTPEVQP